MITLQFPKLETALSKNKKSMTDDDPRKGIIVIQNNAIVFSEDFCLVIDLYEYFTIDCMINDDGELAELKRILYYMNEKVFSAEYWAELTKGANMQMSNGMLAIETPKYAKDLHYKHIDVSLVAPLKQLIDTGKSTNAMVPNISLPFSAINSIYSILKTDFKTDHIIFEFLSQNRNVKFTFKNRKHVYGFIIPDYDSAVESWKFHTWENFISNKDVFDLYQKEKEKSVPPPPITSMEVVEDDEPENTLFDAAKE